MDSVERIRKYSNANGTSGFEQEIVRLFADDTKGLGKLEVDGMFNAILRRARTLARSPWCNLTPTPTRSAC